MLVVACGSSPGTTGSLEDAGGAQMPGDGAASEGGQADAAAGCTASSPCSGEGGSAGVDSALADAPGTDGADAGARADGDAGAGSFECGAQSCTSTQVCVQWFPCGGPGPSTGCSNPPPSCVDAPQGCASETSCTCFGAAVCVTPGTCNTVSGRNVTCANQ